MATRNGTAASETLNGTSAADQLFGFAGNDVLNGFGADDLLTGGLGNDTLNGGTERDTANYDDAAGGVDVSLTSLRGSGALGNDTLNSIENLRGGGFADILTGNSVTNNLSGLGGADIIDAGGGTDVLSGGAGDDVLRGGGGSDTLNGGLGLDLIDLTDATQGASFELEQSGTNTPLDLSGIGLGIDTYRSMEGVIGTAFRDVLAGSVFEDTLRGMEGNDELDGRRGNDTLDGGPGNDTFVRESDGGFDTVAGGPGNDALRVRGTDDGERFSLRPDGSAILLDEQVAGAPLVRLSFVDRVEINAEGGNDTFQAAAGSVDFLNRGLFGVTYHGGGGTDLLVGGTAGFVELTAFGEADRDVLQGGPADDTLDGGDDNDRLTGLGGRDTLRGGPGDDTFLWSREAGNDTVDGGADTDTVEIAGVDDFRADRGDDLLLQAEGDVAVVQSRSFAGTVELRMSAVESLDINLRQGPDVIELGDLSSAGISRVTIRGGDQEDTVAGQDTNARLIAFGGADDDLIVGGREDDTLEWRPGRGPA